MKLPAAICAASLVAMSLSYANSPSPDGMAEKLIEHYHMQLIPREGAWFSQTYASEDQIDGAALPDKATVVLNPKMQPPVIGVMFPGSSLVGSYSLEDGVLTISTGGFGAAQKMIVLNRVTP